MNPRPHGPEPCALPAALHPDSHIIIVFYGRCVKGKAGILQFSLRGSVVAFSLVGILCGERVCRSLLGEGNLQHRLRPVERDLRVAALLLRRLLQQLQQFLQRFPGQIAAAPVEEKELSLADGLRGPLGHILLLREGQLHFPVIGPGAVIAGGGGVEQRLMIPQQMLVIQIEVIVADHAVMAEAVVKSDVQVVILPAQPDDVPRMAVFDPLIGGGIGDSSDIIVKEITVK